MNNVNLIGRLTADVELRATASGISATTFSLAVPRTYNREETDFINCVAWRKQAENLSKYCGKGSRIAVTGRMEVRNYTAQDGSKRYVTEVVADSIEFLDTKKEGTATEEVVEKETNAFEEFANEVEISDDDLPF